MTTLAGLHVLVVEDDSDSRDVFAQTLEHCGAVVSVSDAGDVALNDLKEFQPDVIVCDLAMPRMDGVAFLRALRAHEHQGTRDIPVIAVTAFHERFRREDLLAVGASEYFRKPVRLEQLFDAVRRLTGGPRPTES